MSEALRTPGHAPFDPVRLHFLEALARRTQAHDGAVKALLENKLQHALAAYQERLAHHLGAPSDAGRAPSPLPHNALADLTRHLAQQPLEHTKAVVQGGDARMGAHPELKSVRNFRNTWSQLSVEKQLTQALAQAPENAGPLNSHQLVLRSLSVMRNLSPDYLSRFMSYVDTLLWLDQVENQPLARSPAGNDGVKKRKASRTRTG